MKAKRFHRRFPQVLLPVLLGLTLLVGVAWAQGGQGGLDMRDRAAEALTLTDQTINEAGATIAACNDQQARSKFTQGQNIQATARSQFNAAHYGDALLKTLQAIGLVREALSLCSGAASAAVTRALLEETDRYLSEAAQLSNFRNASERVRTIYSQALALQQQAHQAADRGQWDQARNFSNEVRSKLQELLALAAGNSEERSKRAEDEVSRTDELLQRITTTVDLDGDDQVSKVVQDAVQLQQQAHDALRGERPLQALQITMQVRERLKQARRDVASGDNQADQLAQVLARAGEMLAKARENCAGSKDPNAAQILARAQELLTRANTEAGAGNPGRALKLAGQAADQAAKATSLCTGATAPQGNLSNAPDSDLDPVHLEQTLTATEEKLLEAISKVTSDAGQQLLTSARQALTSAREAQKSGDLKKAMTLARKAGQDIAKSIK